MDFWLASLRDSWADVALRGLFQDLNNIVADCCEFLSLQATWYAWSLTRQVKQQSINERKRVDAFLGIHILIDSYLTD